MITVTTAPKISVLLPVFNGEEFLAETLASILVQSLHDIEIIAINDGSTDATAAILEKVSRQDGRLKVFHQKNCGISDSLNAALGFATAPLVARIDSDDLMEPTRLERQLAFIADHPDIAGCGSYFSLINKEGQVRGEIRPLPRSVEELHRYLAGGGQLRYTHPTLLYKRDAALGVGGYRREYEPCEDVDLFLRMTEAGQFIIIQPEFLTRYRVHGGSISSKSASQQHMMLNLVYANFNARLAHRAEIDFPTFQRNLAHAPLWERIHYKAGFWSEMLYRRHTKHLMEGHKAASRLNLLAAASLKPRRALSRALRMLRQ
jgi:glycosyltransferase involved in cell wall biosynthesis